jgi:hypothetical protein
VGTAARTYRAAATKGELVRLYKFLGLESSMLGDAVPSLVFRD